MRKNARFPWFPPGYWHLAVQSWRNGEDARLVRGLLGGDLNSMPDEVRVFVAAVVAGKVTRPAGRPRQNEDQEAADTFLGMYARAVYKKAYARLCDAGEPDASAAAKEQVAEELGISVAKVKRLLAAVPSLPVGLELADDAHQDQ